MQDSSMKLPPLNELLQNQHIDECVKMLKTYLELREYYSFESAQKFHQDMLEPILLSINHRIAQLEYRIAMSSIEIKSVSENELLEKINNKEEIQSYLQSYTNISNNNFEILQALFWNNYVQEIQTLLIAQPYNKKHFIHILSMAASNLQTEEQAQLIGELFLTEPLDLTEHMFAEICLNMTYSYLYDKEQYSLDVLKKLLGYMVAYTKSEEVAKASIFSKLTYRYSQDDTVQIRQCIENIFLNHELLKNLPEKHVVSKFKI